VSVEMITDIDSL